MLKKDMYVKSGITVPVVSYVNFYMHAIPEHKYKACYEFVNCYNFIKAYLVFIP